MNLDRMVIDSVHRAELSTGVDLPWETGILGEVFGEPGRLLPSLRYEACEVPMLADPMAATAKRPRLRAPTAGALHANIIRRGQLVSDEELECKRMAQAAETWYTVESLGLAERFSG